MNPNDQIEPISGNHHNHKNQRLKSPNRFIFKSITTLNQQQIIRCQLLPQGFGYFLRL